ncbi:MULTISPECIES: arginase family protein [Arthrobacter]|uniref:Arginase family protein n=1 Tax=Arthrobacter terricola TaxID=2547396 RepID=A0A4R5KA00_9MICC|nr:MULTISPECIES: arginase family protein [Arthrobacter]MBT8163162.1 arginase family protein [Arthrobacter sp. GN70]TDF91268.1 arginase family protein [Arthrobacter terricola]
MKNHANSLRLLWPQWQGAAPDVVGTLAPELPLPAAQTGYSLGTRILDLLVPEAAGQRTETVPVSGHSPTLGTDRGVYARDVIIEQLQAALNILADADPDRVTTLGGECSVSVAPFSHLAAKYGDDLAVVWLDAHPDCTLPSSNYDGYHAMAISHLTGHGDPDVLNALPATIHSSRIALAGLHSWAEDELPNIEAWGLATFPPNVLNQGTDSLIDWLKATGCSKVAIHLDLDVIDSNDLVLGLGMEPDGLTRDSVAKTIAALNGEADVVALTVAEYLPRQVLALQDLVGKIEFPS